MKSLLLSSFFLGSIAWSAAFDHDTTIILKEISQRYKELGSWSAEVSESKISLGLGASKAQQGTFQFSQPESFRFALEGDSGKESSLIVTDGEKAWQFLWREGKEKAPNVRVFSNVKNLELERYMIFVRGIDMGLKNSAEKLQEQFDVSAARDGKLSTLLLKPRGPSSLQSVELHFFQGRAAPTKVVVTDELDNKTNIEIVSFKAKQSFEEKLFNPDIPKGAKVEKAD